MNCPNCQQPTLKPRATTTGVEPDRCEQCDAVWLDRGELFFFVRDQRGFGEAIENGRRAALASVTCTTSSTSASVGSRVTA